MQDYIKKVLSNFPQDWLTLTTHRLDIYNESLAKSEFLSNWESLCQNAESSQEALAALPTAYDYIRLGHPLSCVLEWLIGQKYSIEADRVISFSSWLMPVMAVLRKNHLDGISTRIYYKGTLPASFDPSAIANIYQYQFELRQIDSLEEIEAFDGINVLVCEVDDVTTFELDNAADIYVNRNLQLGSVLLMKDHVNDDFVAAVQHVRRRESIAMTPINTLNALRLYVGMSVSALNNDVVSDKKLVLNTIKEITGTAREAIVASSGLSMQYAIVMGLVDFAYHSNPDKPIRIIVPSNCYGGTNDQARRVAACNPQIEVLDWAVDAGADMVDSLDTILDQVAQQNALAYIIAEIPTNPRVEVPDLARLKDALTKSRLTSNGYTAEAPVFILDQTFCPNVRFLAEGSMLSEVKTIAYVSGSKFPSGGRCTAGYCVGNNKGSELMDYIERHLALCDNGATEQQLNILAAQMPSMLQRIQEAYTNTADFVAFIKDALPTAKINFVSDDLAQRGYTPSVFSMDLPTKGNTDAEREAYKRALNLKLINMMIKEIPAESKFCVSYGQLKGCYWTIPATSTQGTTKEADKDYIVRVAISPSLDLDRHKEIFRRFVAEIV